MNFKKISLLLASSMILAVALTSGCASKAETPNPAVSEASVSATATAEPAVSEPAVSESTISVASLPDNTSPLWEAGTTRDKIVVMSDVHLGIIDEYSETRTNLPYLMQFLKRLENTKDVRELVIAGDFLDEWFLPVYYPSYNDEVKFYKDVIANNQELIDEFNRVMDSGITLVYVPGNHDMLLESGVLQEAMPNIVQARDTAGLGTYYTGDRKEIAIEHGHRYDVFSAPDSVTNAELCGNDDTILPAGYFYARYAATWMLEGQPKVEKDLPAVTTVPDKSDVDQYGAYIYYSILSKISKDITPKEAPDEKIFDMHIAGFDDTYTYLDFYPAQQAGGTISAPVLFKNIQRTWGERQKLNAVSVQNTFIEAVSGAVDGEYFFNQAKIQHIDNEDENVDVVVFGHTHVPMYRDMGNGSYYINDGTWIDNNNLYPATRTFTVITTGDKDKANLYCYMEDGSLRDIAADVSKENAKEE